MNFIQMYVTLRIIAFTFDRHDVLKKLRNDDKNEVKIDLTVVEIEIKEFSLLNYFCYCFNYIGLIGPFYTFKSFSEFFNLPFAVHADGLNATINKLKIFIISFTLYTLVCTLWP